MKFGHDLSFGGCERKVLLGSIQDIEQGSNTYRASKKVDEFNLRIGDPNKLHAIKCT